MGGGAACRGRESRRVSLSARKKRRGRREKKGGKKMEEIARGRGSEPE